jgi:gentisate 1,2-dioxygenase
MEYVNPATGTGPVLETLSLRLQLLRDGEETDTHRHNSTEIYYVRSGSGHTEVDGERYEWSEGDCLVVPPGSWHSHASDAAETILFVTSDQPVFDSFNIHRIEQT